MKKRIEPIQSHGRLCRQIKRCRGNRTLSVWWLGQSGFVFAGRGMIVGIDLYLSDSLAKKYASTSIPHDRMMKSPLFPEELDFLDLVLSTHQHTDHMDQETLVPILKNSSSIRYLFPKYHQEKVFSWRIPREVCLPVIHDRVYRVGEMKIIPIPSAHEKLDFSRKQGYPYLGYILKWGKMVFYHSGDTIPYPGLAAKLSGHRVHTAFLPINGRGSKLRSSGISGNCTIQEALCLAELAGVKRVIPHHYDMFLFNTGSIEQFQIEARERYPGLDYQIPKGGDRIILG